MRIKNCFLVIIFFHINFLCKAQHDFYLLKGKIYDVNENAPVAYAKICIMSDSILLKKTESDINGKYIIDSLTKGTYTIKVLAIGYRPIIKSSIKLNKRRIKIVNIEFPKPEVETKKIDIKWGKPYVKKTAP